MVVKGNDQLMRNCFCSNVLFETWWHFLGSYKAKVYTDTKSLKYFETQTQINTKPLRWHITLVVLKVDLIHKTGFDNMVLDALNERKEFQAININQMLWLMFADEENLWCKIREGIY